MRKHLFIILVVPLLFTTSGCHYTENDDPQDNTSIRFEEPVLGKVVINRTILWTVDLQVREIQPDTGHVEWKEIQIRIFYVNETLAIPLTRLHQFNTTAEYYLNSLWYFDNGKFPNQLEVNEVIRIAGIDETFKEAYVGVIWRGRLVCSVRLPSEFV